MIADLANHLWQSSVFGLAAGLLTLAFRKNQARVRYGLWFSASVKFFVQVTVLHSDWQKAAFWRAAVVIVA